MESKEAPKQAERTFIMVKPDGVQRGLVGEIIKRFERKGLKLVALKMMKPSKEHVEQHYKDLASKGFFNDLVAYILSGPVVAMCWEGLDAVKNGRILLGATKPIDSKPGTIRGDFGLDVGRNVCHGSDSVENGKLETAHWFPEGISEWDHHSFSWVYE